MTSQINRPINGNVDNTLHQALIENVRRQLQWSRNRLLTELNRVRALVDRHFMQGSQDVFFKGKWYATLIECDLRDAFRGRPIRVSGVASRIPYVLSVTLDFSDSWADYFIEAVDRVLTQM